MLYITLLEQGSEINAGPNTCVSIYIHTHRADSKANCCTTETRTKHTKQHKNMKAGIKCQDLQLSMKPCRQDSHCIISREVDWPGPETAKRTYAANMVCRTSLRGPYLEVGLSCVPQSSRNVSRIFNHLWTVPSWLPHMAQNLHAVRKDQPQQSRCMLLRSAFRYWFWSYNSQQKLPNVLLANRFQNKCSDH